MGTDVPVTGGDLYALWQAAHMGLPDVQEVYDNAMEKHKNEVAGGDEETFGPCFTAWVDLQAHCQYLISRTQGSLEGARKALDIAIEQYAYVDGDNANALTAAGQELQTYLDEPIYDPDLVDDPDKD